MSEVLGRRQGLDFGLAKATRRGSMVTLTHGGFVGIPPLPARNTAGGRASRRPVRPLFRWASPFTYVGRRASSPRQNHRGSSRFPGKNTSASGTALCEKNLRSPDQTPLPHARHGPRGTTAICPEPYCPSLKRCLAAIDQPRRPRRIAAVTLGALILHMAELRYYVYHQKARTLNPPEKSVAVLPFANLSTEKENAYFASGVQTKLSPTLPALPT